MGEVRHDDLRQLVDERRSDPGFGECFRSLVRREYFADAGSPGYDIRLPHKGLSPFLKVLSQFLASEFEFFF